MKYYLVGIKGTGMCALAKTLKDMNHDVFGSDTSKIFFTDKILKDNNIKWKKFNKANITNEYIYIISSCYDKEHLEVKEIMEKGYEYYYYHEFIEKYFKNKIGISGTHGKSTTTSFLVDLFKGKNISGVIGDGTGIGKEKYDYFIFEACEYQKHILTYSFDYLIINNIEEDHLDCYKDIDEIYKTFIEASKKSKCLICNENIKIEHFNKYTFGKGKDNYCFYNIIEKNNKGYKLLITIDNLNYEVDFPFYGKHMIYNLLASITVYYLVNKELNNLQEKINSFRILNRRMNEYYIYDNVIIDDYAHHPTEIKALLSGLEQKYPDKELIVVFQPHTYSRTFSLAKAFVQCFGNYKTYIRNTFTSGREQYSKELEDEVRKIFANYQEYEINKIKKYLEERKKVIVFVGAGDNYNCIQELMKIFSENS